MSAIKITDRISSVGILNPILRIFDVVMKTDYGTTYNSYIVKGDEKTALIETCHLTYFDEYIKNIREVCDPQSIDYIVMNHCEPDHSGALRKLLELCPKATVVVSRAGALFLKNITNRDDLPIQSAADGDKIDLGGISLNFISAPFLHWADSMFTYVPEERLVFSCDFLGCHYCEPHYFDTRIVYPEKYADALDYYYAAIFSPFTPYVREGLKKLEAIEFNIACTSHGPILTREGKLPFVLERYKELCAEKKRKAPLIPVFYCSAYGNTRAIAKQIASGILEAIPDADCKVFDINDYDMGYLSGLVNTSDAFCIGSPTINADAVAPVWQLLSHIDGINIKKRPTLAFGSYGWSGEAVPNLLARLKGLRTKPFEENGFKVCFVPSEADLAAAKELGRAFGDSLK